MDATVNGVQLPMENSKFEKFSQADYDAVYGKIVNKEFEIVGDQDVEGPKEIETQKVAVEEIN